MLNRHMNVTALDIGDVHTGIARADALGMFATPYKTIPSATLITWIDELLHSESTEHHTFVIGYPKTMRDTASAQTNKVLAWHQKLSEQFPHAHWILWDERLSSQQAQRYAKKNIKHDKLYEHAVAAAIVLQAYLEHLRFKGQHIDNP